MKSCPYCTKEIQDNAVKCKHCGGWFTNDADLRQKDLDREEQLEKVLKQDKDPIEEQVSTQTTYFSVPTMKLGILCFLTFGIYELYWFYKNWKEIKLQEGKKLMPFWRAVFAVFFCYSLFKKILTSAQSHGYKAKNSYRSLTVAYIVIVMLYKLPDPFWLISHLSFIPLLFLAQAVRFNNKKVNPAHLEENKLTRKEILFSILGILLWVLTIMGYFYPSEI